MVHTIFQELCDKGLGSLQLQTKADKPIFGDSKQSEDNKKTGITSSLDDIGSSPVDEHPTLENVVLKGSPKKEYEWLLIYAFYCSNNGSTLFTREDLRSKYDSTNRWTEARSKNFAVNIKSLVSNGYISAVNSNDFRIESAGLLKAKAILLGTAPSKDEKQKGKASQGKKVPASYKLIELSLSENDRRTFKAFWDSHGHTTPIDKAVLTAFWLKKEKDIVDFSADHFFTMLRTIEETINCDLASALTNAKNRKSYFVAGTKRGTYAIHHIGEDRIKTLEQKGE